MRKLKLIGLSALAVLAVSAVSASAADAAEGTATVVGGASPQAYTAKQVGTHTFTLPGGRKVTCGVAEFKGSISNGDKSVTATPIYVSCDAEGPGGPFPVTVDTTDCTYKFSDFTTIAEPSEDTYNVATEVCASGGPIHIKVYSSAANHVAGTRLCEYTVSKQNVGGVTFKDNTNGSIQIKATESAVNIVRSFGTLANCGEVNTVSKYNGDTNALADAAGVSLGLHH